MDTDDFEAQIRGSTRRRSVIVGLAVGGLAVGPFAYLLWDWRDKVVTEEKREAEYEASRKQQEAYANRPLDERETIELKDLSTSMRGALAQMRAAWPKAITREALAAITTTDVACPIEMKVPIGFAVDDYVQNARTKPNMFGDFAFTIVGANDALPEPELAELEKAAADIGSRVDAGKLLRADLDRIRTFRLPPAHIVLLVDKKVAPELGIDELAKDGPALAYTPGLLAGRAYIYSHPHGRVLCAGAIEAENGPKIKTEYFYTGFGRSSDKGINMRTAARASLERDLEVQALSAIAKQVHAVKGLTD